MIWTQQHKEIDKSSKQTIRIQRKVNKEKDKTGNSGTELAASKGFFFVIPDNYVQLNT